MPAALAVLASLVLLAGCGGEDVDDARERIDERVERAERDFDRQRARLRERIDDVLRDIDQAVPEAPRTEPAGRSRGRTGPQTIDGYMTQIIENVDGYWTLTLQEAGLRAPRVSYDWVAPGTVSSSACGPADDQAAFYCSADDTIFIGQRFAAALYQGVLRGLPGESAGYGRAAGDFAVAYVVAHEYAHNVQFELGVFNNQVGPTARPYELQADCYAGAWANSVYEQGLLEPGDLEEALSTAEAVGDFDVANEQHHGTPPERRAAVDAGFRSGDPGRCAGYVT